VTPTLTAPPGSPTDQSYIVFAIDLDVPRNGTTTLLHWFEADFTLSSSLILTPSFANTSNGAPYISPNPPPGNPHRYTFLLFSQPDDFTVPESFSNINPPASILARIGFNITRFVAAAGLDAPLAGNYFRVVNTSATASSTGSPAATSPVQYQGGSSPMKSSIGTYLGVVFLLAGMVAGLGDF
jgi:phosphatidylethanolamine-binding protein